MGTLAAAGDLSVSGDDLISSSLTSRYSSIIADFLSNLPSAFLLTDPALPDHPIVFASPAFLALSGYPTHLLLGRNPRIFQGPATDRRSVLAIRDAIRREERLDLTLLNYRRDGSPHWILFHLRPLFAQADGRVVHFLSVQVPIPHRPPTPHLLGSCRGEVRDDPRCNRGQARSSFDAGLAAENETREASEWEREKAASAAEDIVSALGRYSKLTGKLVCGKRCGPAAGVAPLSTALIISLGRIQQSFVLTNPHLSDMPIVYASEEFLALTGYSRHEVLGRNCRFLNGPDTDVEVIHQIRDNIRAHQACTVRILNYRKDGGSFWNRLHISPVRNASGKIAFYVGVQVDDGSKHDVHGLSLEMKQFGAVGAVKVAVRSLSAEVGSSRSS